MIGQQRQARESANWKKLMRCLYCNAVLEGQAEISAKTCSACQDKGRVSSDAARPSRTKRAMRKDKDEEEDHDPVLGGATWRPGPFTIVFGAMLIAWLIAAWLASTNREAAWGLVAGGAAVLLVGMCQIYFTAVKNGIELRTVVPTESGGIGCGAVLVQFFAMPLFSLFYVFMDFEEAWRPVVVELLGIGAIASGVYFLR
jgi:hypothetical protein